MGRAAGLNFQNLDARAFEALCFDLVRRLGYRSVIWRDGAGDRGRDIEAQLRATNPLSDDYSERWFFECKNKKAGIGVLDLVDKIAWADAEKPDHLAFLVSSHLTQDARDHIKKIAPDKRFRIHTIEGRVLAELVQSFPDLVERHFRYSLNEFLGSALRQWSALQILPSAEQLALLAASLDGSRLAPETNALIWVASLFREEELEELDDESPSFEPFLDALRAVARPGAQLLRHMPAFHTSDQIRRMHSIPLELVGDQLHMRENQEPRPDWDPLVAAHIWVEDDRRPYPALYAYIVNDGGGSAIEILVEGGAALTSSVRLVDSTIASDQRNAIAFLRGHQGS